MSLVAAIEKLYAEESDGLFKAVKHLAGEVEKVGGGAPAIDPAKALADLQAAFDAKVDAFLTEQRAAVQTKLAALEADVTAAIAKLHPQPAASVPSGTFGPGFQSNSAAAPATGPAAS